MNDISNICLVALKNKSFLNDDEIVYCINKLNQNDTIKIFKKIECIGTMRNESLKCLCQKINSIPVTSLMSSKNFKTMMNRGDFMKYILLYSNIDHFKLLLTLIEPHYLNNNYKHFKEKLPNNKIELIESILVKYKLEN